MGRTLRLQYDKNKNQVEFHNDLISFLLHLSTGFGGGKTHAITMKAFQLSFINRHIPGGLVQGTYADFKKDWLPLIEQILDEHKVKYTYVQNGKYGPHFRWPWTDAPIYITSAEKKIRGPNWGWAAINELTLIPLIRYQEVMARVRSKKSKVLQIASSGTPEGWANDYYDFLIENPKPDSNIIYGSSRDNLHNMNSNYVTNLENNYDSTLRAAYIEGEWVNMGGHLFYYSYVPKVNDDPTTEDNMWDQVHISIDFNVAPMVAEVWQWDGFKLVGIDEVVIENNAKTKTMCDILKKRGYGPARAIIYPDPSGANRNTKGDPDIKIMQDEGFLEIRKKSKAPGMRTRQVNTNNLLEKARVIINPKKQKYLKRDFLAVEQDIVKLDKIKTNTEQGRKLTHASDGFDYITDILMPFKGHRNIQISNRRIR